MTVLVRTLAECVQVAAADTAYYTTPASTRTIIDKMTATNTTAGTLTLTVNLVASGGSVGASNTVISAQAIAAGATYTCPEVVGHFLNPGDFISAKASAATSITLRISGREAT